MLIRMARPDDLADMLRLSGTLPPGMTSMPRDRAAWERKLALVERTVRGEAPPDAETLYLMVLERGGAVAGTAAVVAGANLPLPFYNYRITRLVKTSEALGIQTSSTVLNLMNDFTGATELASLFLMPDQRGGHGGQLLSRGRYVLMADFPERFSDTVFAEIRGWLGPDDRSPFWEHLGRKFFNMPFAEADFISAVEGPQFISDLMPRHPVYLELLPEEARAVVGRPHDDAVPAVKLLEREGFRYENIIDVFDGGPVLHCPRGDVASIAAARRQTVESLDAGAEDGTLPLCIVSNGVMADYRLAPARVRRLGPGRIALPAAAAAALKVEPGQTVRALELRTGKGRP